jgi:hypothetical protein
MIEQPLFGRISRFLLGVGVGAIATLYFVRTGFVGRDVSLLPLVYFLILIVTAGLLGDAMRAEHERAKVVPEYEPVLARWAERKWARPQRPANRPTDLYRWTDAP